MKKIFQEYFLDDPLFILKSINKNFEKQLQISHF